MPEDYTSETYKGLPSHGALFEMAGHRWEQIKQIETAITHYAQAIAGMLGGAAGGGGAKSSSPTQALKELPQEHRDAIQANTSPEIYDAFVTMVDNLPASSAVDQGGFIVHESEFQNNIVSLFSNTTTVYDLHEALHQLYWDESLRGVDKLEDVTMEMETPYGNNTVTISPRNGTSSSPGGQAQQVIQQIMSFLQSVMNHAANKDQNCFGSGAETIGDQIQRIGFETQTKIQQTLQMAQSDKEGNKCCDDIQRNSTAMSTIAKLA